MDRPHATASCRVDQSSPSVSCDCSFYWAVLLNTLHIAQGVAIVNIVLCI